jgi:hypothetical protein
VFKRNPAAQQGFRDRPFALAIVRPASAESCGIGARLAHISGVSLGPFANASAL